MNQLIVGLCAIYALFSAGLVDSSPLVQSHHLLGSTQCTWGPSFWCSNITNAKGCNAVRHCIHTVWEHTDVAEDNDSICKICKDMVTQARDQLRSNETMEELREVFEGSCNLIPIKIVKKQCCKLADDFIPELVEALSSEMNPDQVCTVAGLCNNAEIDRLLTKYYASALDGTLKEEDDASAEIIVPTHTKSDVSELAEAPLLSCGNCHSMASLLTNKLQSANRDEILDKTLHICGQMSSFSDACANIALTYFNDVYTHIKQNLETAGVCHISGVCAAKYHQHPTDPKEEEPIDLIAYGKDDIPCELCEQLVRHLRDVLVANTTESEFKQVLEGLCNQSKGFRTECLSIVDQYYDLIYQSLVNNLDANGACFLIGVCPKGSDAVFKGNIMPLLPVVPPAEIKVTIRKKLGAKEPKFTEDDIKAMTLPIDHLMGAANPNLYVENGELCTLCEYILHFIQESLSTPATEDDIKQTINGICNKLPNGIKGQCHNFIDMYGDAVMALLVQGLDPRECCPKMRMCPPNKENHDDMEVFDPQPSDEQDQPTCPLCLFAVEQAQAKIGNDKSKKNIEHVLDQLCNHLPPKLQYECVDFVKTYSSELIDMLISDFKPQEICVGIKLCPKPKNYLDELGISLENDSEEADDLALNEIDDSDEMGVEIVFQHHNNEAAAGPNCLMCIEVVKLAEKRLNKHTTKEDIKKALEQSCMKLSKNLQPKCHQYMDKYGDKIADLLIKEMEPKLICAEIGMCLFSEQEDLEIDEALKYDVIAMPNDNNMWHKNDRFVGMDESLILQEPPTCVLCEFVMTKLETVLQNKTEQEDIKHAIENVCHLMPNTVSKSCNKFIDKYANDILLLVASLPPKEICQKLQICLNNLTVVLNADVIECGVCHGAAKVLLPYLRQHAQSEQTNAVTMTDVGCKNVPAKYNHICSEMIRIYGKSIINLSERIALDESNICSQIGKCFFDEDSNLAFARISARAINTNQEDTLLIIKPDYVVKRKPLLLHLMQRGFFIKGQRQIYFTPELAAEFYQDRREDANFMFQIILLSKGNSEAFILSKEHAVQELINTMVCYFGSSPEMEERIHVSPSQNKVQREITFIFPNYIHEPTLFFEKTKFCTDNPLVETTLSALYDIITNPKKEAHKSWREKLSESLISTNSALPSITNQNSNNTEFNRQDIAQQTEISCLNVDMQYGDTLLKASSSDISKYDSSLNFTTSSCLSCTGFDSGTVCLQQICQEPLEEIIKARTICLEEQRQSSSSSLHVEEKFNLEELSVDDQVVVEELCDDGAGEEENEDIYKADRFKQMDNLLSKNINLENNIPTDDFIIATEVMPVNDTLSDKNSTHFSNEENIEALENELSAGEENVRGGEESPRPAEEVGEE